MFIWSNGCFAYFNAPHLFVCVFVEIKIWNFMVFFGSRLEQFFFTYSSISLFLRFPCLWRSQICLSQKLVPPEGAAQENGLDYRANVLRRHPIAPGTQREDLCTRFAYSQLAVFRFYLPRRVSFSRFFRFLKQNDLLYPRRKKERNDRFPSRLFFPFSRFKINFHLSSNICN